MKGILLLAVWLLILLAAAHDASFAWENRHDMASWELNPVARWLLSGGIGWLLVVKFTGLFFAMAVVFHCRRRRHAFQLHLTLIVSCLYLLLSLHYLIGSVTPGDGPVLSANDSPVATEPR
ncbi:MAG: hypothetical protein FJ271_22975 [Planctomycetes bacterium]|nr:hypothetical protein [Planctomycetota bacterium]